MASGMVATHELSVPCLLRLLVVVAGAILDGSVGSRQSRWLEWLGLGLSVFSPIDFVSRRGLAKLSGLPSGTMLD